MHTRGTDFFYFDAKMLVQSDLVLQNLNQFLRVYFHCS
ncbi:Hypothetical protein Bdt_2289 [Bdellovibrio bacteriovorus str. Tiberius]|uniref:Uncharacterized protein n=1 Tax=Bdellovibrio bacteriovorus str. Tiberius TaxID=1069642 RepID=K7ZFZ0_BDEBC|nr:Hypothetical protein Bdt_2289 [Bdellovibrio bacteriovorus str. Tiberius]